MWSVWQTCRTGRRAAGFLGGLLVALLLAAGPAAGQTFPSSNLMTLSNGGEGANPVMAAGVTSSGTEVQVYVAWIEGNEVYLKVGSSPLASPNSCTAGPGALVFGGPKRLFAVNPSMLAMATYDQGVFVAWLSTRFNGEGSPIQLWSSPTESLQDLSFNGNPNNPAVAADSSGVLVAAAEGAGDVWLARTTPTGGFEYLNVTANESGSARRPSIASDGTKVHVVWRNGGVSYRVFDRSVTQAQLDATTIPIPFPTLSLTSASVQFPPKVAVHGGEVTAAWFEGTNSLAPTDLKAVTFPTTGGIFPAPGSALTVHSSTLRHSNLSLSVGPGGRLFGWQVADTIALTSSNHYLLKAATDRPFESGSYYESTPSLPAAGPSVVQDAAGRVVASWKETVATTPAIRAGYEGSSGSGDGMLAEVRVTPSKVNLRTMDVPGQPSLTVFIQLPQGSEIDDSLVVKMNEQGALPGSRVVGDHNGDGTRDVMVKFNRSALRYNEEGKLLLLGATTAPTRNYKVKGNIKGGGCFSGRGTVDIIQ